MAETGGTQPQVRLQLTTRDENLALPENLGPILVPSCKDFVELLLLSG